MSDSTLEPAIPPQLPINPLSGASLSEYLAACVQGPVTEELLNWPPDIFALMCSLLQKTGAYIRLTSNWPPIAAGDFRPELKDWTASIKKIGVEWWRAASNKEKPPAEVKVWWDTLMGDSKSTILELEAKGGDHIARFWDSVLELAAAADESCRGIGALGGSPNAASETAEDIIVQAQELLQSSTSVGRATACRRVLTTCGSVLPKMHTPESGITLRSISHWLAFVRAADICPKYYYHMPSATDGHCINVLLYPWPFEVAPTNFGVAPERGQKMGEKFGFFDYATALRPECSKTLEKLLEAGDALVGKIDGVIMPELSLNEGEQNGLFEIVTKGRSEAFLIAGVGEKPTSESAGKNTAIFLRKFAGTALPVEVRQPKHHRWRLEEKQIEMYGLGSSLDPNRNWWEDISVESRQLAFIGFSNRMTVSVLICEDLARQDPVSEVIRAVGPNLIVALLMDGPQLESRWPAHYATVLADDPGSSVLTLTSLGMTKLSRPPGKPISRVIALWKDHLRGFRQVELPADAEAIVLSLTLQDIEEWAADGRSDNTEATYLLLNGIHPISLSHFNGSGAKIAPR